MRFIQADDDPEEITLVGLKVALEQIDASCSIGVDDDASEEGDFRYDGEVYGEIEMNRPGDGLFDEELEELREEVEVSDSPNRRRILDALDNARAMVVVRVLWSGRESEETLEKIGLLWEWLLAHRRGILQTDEGYFDDSGLILGLEG